MLTDILTAKAARALTDSRNELVHVEKRVYEAIKASCLKGFYETWLTKPDAEMMAEILRKNGYVVFPTKDGSGFTVRWDKG